MKRIILLLGGVVLFNCTMIGQQNEIASNNKTILAIFAHPDDELLTGTTLAHYAAKGVKVYVAIATDGALGTTDFANIPAGRELVAIRKNEMTCSAQALGIEPPIFLGLPDQLNAMNGGLQNQIDNLRTKVDSLLHNYRPDIVLTFGAAGWTGHPDHQLVENVVTDVFASKTWDWRPKLYYSELISGTINEKSWAEYVTVSSDYLSIRVPLDSLDYLKLRKAFQCHKSQYRETVRKRLPLFIESIQKDTATFRPFIWDGKLKNSLFQ